MHVCESLSLLINMAFDYDEHRCDCSCDDLQTVERPSPVVMVVHPPCLGLILSH
jgi:hypothetical protein